MPTAELFREDAYLQTCNATVTGVSDEGVCLDQTVFYPTGGGQPGDTGELRVGGRVVRVIDTRKGDDGIVHVLEEGTQPPALGDAVTATIDWGRRHKLMRMHTCLHLLCSVIPAGVTGGSVGEEKSRLDFDWPEATLDKEDITAQLNRLIQEDHPANPRWITDEELDAQPDLVRTMSVRPPTGQGTVRLLDIAGVDLQPCGGTHVKFTAEIGAVRVAKIEKKGKQNRRVVVVFDE